MNQTTKIAALLAVLMVTPFAVAQEKPSAKSGKAMACENCAPKTGAKKAGRDACAVPKTMTLSGLDCPGCANGIKSALAEVTGVEEVTVDVKAQKAVVWVCPHKNVTTKALTEAVTGAGFKVVRVEDGTPKAPRKPKAGKRG
ncbi:MAG: heavy metal-associated domain-containing protein [Capsulimonadales bacterium]|nr:heavy metal-associated domain-containing protein [Capsulimonadales bacterium]